MSETDPPPMVRTLLRERVRSFEALESIVLLHRSPEEGSTLQAVAEALRLPPEIVAEALAQLAQYELVSRSPGPPPVFRYAPATPELGLAVDALVRAHAANALGVGKVMSEYAIERMRTGAVRAFSDAFLIRRKDEDG